MRALHSLLPGSSPSGRSTPRPGLLRRAAACTLLGLLASCGGGGGNGGHYTDGDYACTASDDKRWLRDEMETYYFWAGRSPDPAPDGYNSVYDYLDARRFQGDADEPRDRFSYIESTSAFDQFFVDGETLGYGLSVNGVEGTLPLKVRYVDPQSPAATAGVARGDTIVSVNGTTAAQLVAGADFSVLSPSREGDTLTVVLDHGGTTRTVSLVADTYALVPVTATTVFSLPGGGKAGYLSMKDFITQSEGPLATAIAQIRQQGATQLILDLRYNGGGRVSTATHLASLITGQTYAGDRFTLLVHNPQRQQDNAEYVLASQPGNAFTRVVVLTGPRTCSASEMVVNGLKPYVDVVTIGGTSCGKPVGFSPQDHCDSVYSLVNFESINADNQGRYYNGLPLTCAVTDDFTKSLGDATETLTAAALTYANAGACPAGTAVPSGLTARALSSTPKRTVIEPTRGGGMWAD